ncbi:ribulose-phosphate 3-epimerase [Verrucomicrobiaceae bacterium R5-34]|uniref:Ribulose-phosphate 3-epimerase n=1 Tax=Oceaniferula flava TaxID=2800421 RepID=A0AAE2SGJ9_9BACT|nr:ribulose-phosphate 3-epimerase [Oceaniferula flavus]MBK1830844.1 ribulose-phosphate 3-epimerase [Verrucomicrobiaceae bacterium R5-34]MBK1856487.1 ribulose-phosphate 3-epimerase [Oceaniferula flavus]MBM1137794.1 ribulose-phosphate 3-epimerase [Oceaniferula flavus]
MPHSDKLDRLKSVTSGAPQLSIGTLTGDMMHQANDIQILESEGIQLLHLDVMDGTVWPKISVGSGFLAGLKTDLLKDVHLLTSHPEKHVADFAAAGADIITVQIEQCDDVAATLTSIREAGCLASAGIYPTTPIEELLPYLDLCDVVFLLSIGPDTGKQTYFDVVADRISQLRDAKPELVLAIDGAVKKDNVGELAAMQSDLIVTGSAIFDGVDPSANIQAMTASINNQ